MSGNDIHDAQRVAYLQARAALTAWDWAEVENPRTYGDLHSGPVADGREPNEVARKLWRDLQARRSA